MKKIIAGNWKMNLSSTEVSNFLGHLKGLETGNEVIIFPSSIYIEQAVKSLENFDILVGAQNIAATENGAFTGEISASQVTSIGTKLCLVGHSERRNIFGETSEIVNIKAKLALKNNITPVVCIGENLKERESNIYKDIIKTQLTESLEGLNISNIIIAYEPVWAIGTGLNANSKQIAEAHQIIKDVIGEEAKILYGGSVNESNYSEILDINNVSGVLIGGASLNFEKFATICSYIA